MKRILLFLIILTSLTSMAKPRGQIVCIDNSVFVAFCDNSIEDYISRQQKDNWCWAACVQMMMRYQGEWQSQSDIVEKVYGDPYNWTATGNDIAEALNGLNGWRAKSFKQKAVPILIDELVSYGPVMVGTEEHAYLLTHIFYTKDYIGEASPFKVVLINPKTGKEEVRNWSDFFPAINTIVSIWKR